SVDQGSVRQRPVGARERVQRGQHAELRVEAEDRPLTTGNEIARCAVEKSVGPEQESGDRLEPVKGVKRVQLFVGVTAAAVRMEGEDRPVEDPAVLSHTVQ